MAERPSGGLHKLNQLLEATALLHSQLPLDEVLANMLDHAVSITDADRGLLLESDAGGTLKVHLARRSGRLHLPPESLTPSQTAIQLALKQQSPVITEDPAQADMDLQGTQSIVAQRLHAVVVIPVWALTRANTQESMINVKPSELLAVLYLDSKRLAAFSKLDRQILDALAADAASVLHNVRLAEHERPQQAVKAYFDGLAAKDVSSVPWADSATLRTPLNPAGGESALIRGRKAILDFFAGILPALIGVKVVRHYAGESGWVAAQAEIALSNGKTLYVLDAFHVQKGEIVEQQNHYDSRPATG